VHGQGVVDVHNNEIKVTFPKRAHNPILRAVDWKNLPHSISWLDGANLTLEFC